MTDVGLLGSEFAIVFFIGSLVAGLVFFVMVLSIAIDCARLLRRANKLIDLLQNQNAILAHLIQVKKV